MNLKVEIKTESILNVDIQSTSVNGIGLLFTIPPDYTMVQIGNDIVLLDAKKERIATLSLSSLEMLLMFHKAGLSDFNTLSQ